MKKQILQTINQWRTRGAIAPSSRFLVEKMISKIDYSNDLEILQLGFGTGVFTQGMIKKMTPGSTLVVFEVNPACRQYQVTDSRITYIEDSAEQITEYFPNKKFDHIISTLPFASLPKTVSKNIFIEIQHHLKINGKFLQFQYSLHAKAAIQKLFNTTPKIYFELFNIPPAFIYETTNTS